MSVRDEIAAAYALLRQPAQTTAPSALGAMRASRVRVSVDAVLVELLGGVAEAFPATARVTSAIRGATWAWVEDYLRSAELAARPSSTRFATLGQLAVTFPAFVQRAIVPGAGPYGALLDDALACETAINQLRAPDPILAAILHRLRGPFADPGRLLSPAALAEATAVGLAAHARVGTYGRDVASLIASARAHLAGLLPPGEWVASLDTHPGLSARRGTFHAVHVLRASGDVVTLQIGEAAASALSQGAVDPRASGCGEDLVRVAAAGGLRAHASSGSSDLATT